VPEERERERERKGDEGRRRGGEKQRDRGAPAVVELMSSSSPL
jgi:hypothetical protein